MSSHRLADSLTSATALLNDMQNTVLLIALKGRCSPERRESLMAKCDWLKDHLSRLEPDEKG